jgi:hypothetical protein
MAAASERHGSGKLSPGIAGSSTPTSSDSADAGDRVMRRRVGLLATCALLVASGPAAAQDAADCVAVESFQSGLYAGFRAINSCKEPVRLAFCGAAGEASTVGDAKPCVKQAFGLVTIRPGGGELFLLAGSPGSQVLRANWGACRTEVPQGLHFSSDGLRYACRGNAQSKEYLGREAIWTEEAIAAEKPRSGRGAFLFNGSQWDGEWLDGKPHGKGVGTFANGNRYEGEMRNGRFGGRGVLVAEDGTRYEGVWVDGRRNGQGLVTYPNGNRYEGSWRNDKREGRGTLTYESGGHYEGDWSGDKAQGRGVLVYASGDRYEGD